MNQLDKAIHTALRDDSVATIGLRARLGHAATPWGVYDEFPPETPDYSTESYLIWGFLSGPETTGAKSVLELEQAIYTVTVYTGDKDKRNDIMRRVKYVLHRMRRVTLPTSENQLIDIQRDGKGPPRFNDNNKVYSRTDQYRVWYRDDI